MTAVYAPLQNASAAQRGALSTALQEIAGLKKFLDGLEAAHLEVANSYPGEDFTVDGIDLTAQGMSFSLGGPTVAPGPFWGVRAQSIATGGEAGTFETLGIGRFPGDGPLDLIRDSLALAPGLTLSTNAFARSASLIADEVALGLNAAGTDSAMRLDEGRVFFRAPLHVGHIDAEFLSGAQPFRFGDGVVPGIHLRLPSNDDAPGAHELWATQEGGHPLSVNRADLLTYSLRASLLDGIGTLGAVHAFTVDQSVLDDYLAVFGTHDGTGFNDYASQFRISSRGAPEIVNKHAAGPVSDWDMGAEQASVLAAGMASGSIEEPAAGQFYQVTVQTPQCRVTSLPRVITVGAVTTAKGEQILPYVYGASDGYFIIRFLVPGSSGDVAWNASAAGGELRWEISR